VALLLTVELREQRFRTRAMGGSFRVDRRSAADPVDQWNVPRLRVDGSG
jgi:hypothetical protein